MQRINLKLLPGATEGSEHALQEQAKIAKPGRRLLSPVLSHILSEIKREIGLDLAGSEELKDFPDQLELQALILKIAEQSGFELSSFERDEVLAELEREQHPFGVLQDLVDDPSVSDIIVSSYAQIAVQQGRRTHSTDLAFASQEAYEAFVERLLQRAGAAYSTKAPIADGMLGSYARIHAVHKSLCESGPYLTIRINRFSTVSTDDLCRFGLAPKEILNYLKGVVNLGQTLLVVGEVGTGKTTLLRAIASNIPVTDSILVIEDTPEIQLEHPHVRYVRTRDANTDGAGRVSPSECIRAGMRMAMNRIIFGEIRGAEAAEAFIDVCASGHPGLSTIHARSASEALTRMELFLGRAQKGVSKAVLNEQLSTAVQVIVFVNVCPISGKRRIIEVKEIGGAADGVLRQRELFRYQVKDMVPSWCVVNRVSNFREGLETLEEPVKLSALAANVELEHDVMYREAVSRQ